MMSFLAALISVNLSRHVNDPTRAYLQLCCVYAPAGPYDTV